MGITRDVVHDLLPIYVANEASADTRALVEEYLKTDPELADVAKEMAAMELRGDIPVPLKKEDQMEAYKEAKRLMFLRTIILTAIVSFSLVAILLVAMLGAGFFISSP